MSDDTPYTPGQEFETQSPPNRGGRDLDLDDVSKFPREEEITTPVVGQNSDSVMVCWVCQTYYDDLSYEYCPHCRRDLTEVTADD